MKFEEQFPELKDWVFSHTATFQGEGWVQQSEVEKHCLSKQRAREAIKNIEKLWDNPPLTDNEICLISDIKVYLESELGI